jgi:hypothetical protein
VLDDGGQFDEDGRPGQDADGLVELVLDEAPAVRREDCGVQEPVADQDLRPGAGLGDRGLGRASGTRDQRCASFSGAVARCKAGPPVAYRGAELRLFRFSRTRGSARRGC